MNKINVYACGGAGINIASWFESSRGRSETGLAQVNPIYIDTSRSNLKPELDEGSIYIIDGLDGSGKVRSENFEKISESVLDILLKHPAGDLNVVLSSGSGGSGSVIAPSLVSNLLSRDIPTLVFLVGSTDSKIELVNTTRTLKSYESIAKLRKKPVVSMYFENSEKTSRKVVNTDAQQALVLLAALFSGANKELDSSDLKNWLNYSAVTTYGPRLSIMDFFLKSITLDKGLSPIAIATIAEEDANTSPGLPVEYHTVGYADKDTISKLKISPALHAVVLDGALDSTYKRLEKDLAILDEASAARNSGRNTILDSKDTSTDNGVVL